MQLYFRSDAAHILWRFERGRDAPVNEGVMHHLCASGQCMAAQVVALDAVRAAMLAAVRAAVCAAVLAALRAAVKAALCELPCVLP